MNTYTYYDIIPTRTIVKFCRNWSSACKLLLHCVFDQHKTWLYCGGTWEGHEGVYGRQIASPEKMATEIPSLMEKDSMFFLYVYK